MSPILLIATILFFVAAALLSVGCCIKGMQPAVSPAAMRHRNARTSRRLERAANPADRRHRGKRARRKAERAGLTDDVLAHAAAQKTDRRGVARLPRETRKSRRAKGRLAS